MNVKNWWRKLWRWRPATPAPLVQAEAWSKSAERYLHVLEVACEAGDYETAREAACRYSFAADQADQWLGKAAR